MSEDALYKHVKERVKAMGEGTAQQVLDAMNSENPTPYSTKEVETQLGCLVEREPQEFSKVGFVYRWTKQYRFRIG